MNSRAFSQSGNNFSRAVMMMDYVCFGETKDKHLNRSLRHGTEMRHRNLRPDSVRYIRFRYPTLGGAGGFGDQGVGGAQEGHGGAGATED